MFPEVPKVIYEAGPYCIDPFKRVLTKDGHRVPLEGKTFDVFLALLQNRDRVLSRNELLDMAWKPDEHVIPANADQHVYLLRRGLGDSSKSPRYIATFPKCGYKFIHVVVERYYTEPAYDP